MPAYRSEETRFWEKVDKSGDCWIWTASLSSKGYGQFAPYQGIPTRAHRWAYEHEVGPVPDGKVLDHLCGTKSCVRPSHLEPVSNAENLRRGNVGAQNAAHHRAKTHCRNGHEYTEENTRYLKRIRRGVLTRQCIRCYDETQKRHRDK